LYYYYDDDDDYYLQLRIQGSDNGESGAYNGRLGQSTQCSREQSPTGDK